MRRLMLFSLMLCAPAWASPELERVCALQAKSARGIMEGRQDGFPAERAMELAGQAPERLREWFRQTTLDAYAEQRWHGPDAKRRAVEDFGDSVYMSCMGVKS